MLATLFKRDSNTGVFQLFSLFDRKPPVTASLYDDNLGFKWVYGNGA